MNVCTCPPLARSLLKASLASKRCLHTVGPRLGHGSHRLAPAPSKAQKNSPYDHNRVVTSRNNASAKGSATRTKPQRSNSLSQSYEQILPPTALLQTAYKSGALQISPEQVMEFFREFVTASLVDSPGWQRRVCLNNNVDPPTLSLLSGILDKCEDPAQRRFGAVLLGTAAKFGDRAAILKRVYEANQTRQLHFVPDALKEVGLMAEKGDDPQAMTLMGMVCFTQGRETLALEWLRKATANSLDFHGAANALLLQGRILAPHDVEGAQAAFQRAAMELDDPEAFFRLSVLEEPNSTAQNAYLLQAASSGLLEACHNFGMLHMANFGAETNMSLLDDYGLARDWTEIAAEGGFGLSMLNMAQMCRGVGMREEEMQWLEKAAKKSEVREQAEKLIEQWEDENLIQE